jgi:hypothetical protein
LGRADKGGAAEPRAARRDASFFPAGEPGSGRYNRGMAEANGSERPGKRRGFQFHLSTAIVLMFVAGGLVWANVRSRELGTVVVSMGSQHVRTTLYGRGWPWVFDEWCVGNRIGLEAGEVIGAFVYQAIAGILDTVIAWGSLIGVGVLYEWLIRRRGQRA